MNMIPNPSIKSVVLKLWLKQQYKSLIPKSQYAILNSQLSIT